MNFLQHFLQFFEVGLFCSFNGDFAELFEVLHEGQGILAGACAGGFVTLYYLCFSVLCESGYFSVDFFDKLFHN